MKILANYRCFSEANTLFQYHYLIDKNGSRIVDYVGHFETLKEDWKHVCSEIGIPYEELPILNKNEKKHYTGYYQDIYIQNLVYNIYKKDFEYFSYFQSLS